MEILQFIGPLFFYCFEWHIPILTLSAIFFISPSLFSPLTWLLPYSFTLFFLHPSLYSLHYLSMIPIWLCLSSLLLSVGRGWGLWDADSGTLYGPRSAHQQPPQMHRAAQTSVTLYTHTLAFRFILLLTLITTQTRPFIYQPESILQTSAAKIVPVHAIHFPKCFLVFHIQSKVFWFMFSLLHKNQISVLCER